MRTQYSLMLFFLCLNISATLITELQIVPAMGVEGATQKAAVERLANQTGAEQVATQWQPGAMESFWGNIVSSFSLIVTGVSGFFFGFPIFLRMIGTPEPLVWGLGSLMSFVFGWFFLEVITGRSISD